MEARGKGFAECLRPTRRDDLILVLVRVFALRSHFHVSIRAERRALFSHIAGPRINRSRGVKITQILQHAALAASATQLSHTTASGNASPITADCGQRGAEYKTKLETLPVEATHPVTKQGEAMRAVALPLRLGLDLVVQPRVGVFKVSLHAFHQFAQALAHIGRGQGR